MLQEKNLPEGPLFVGKNIHGYCEGVLETLGNYWGKSFIHLEIMGNKICEV